MSESLFEFGPQDYNLGVEAAFAYNHLRNMRMDTSAAGQIVMAQCLETAVYHLSGEEVQESPRELVTYSADAEHALIADEELRSRHDNFYDLQRALNTVTAPIANAFADKLPQSAPSRWSRKKPQSRQWNETNGNVTHEYNLAYAYADEAPEVTEMRCQTRPTHGFGHVIGTLAQANGREELSVTWFRHSVAEAAGHKQVLGEVNPSLAQKLNRLSDGYANGISIATHEAGGGSVQIYSEDPANKRGTAYIYDSLRNVFIGPKGRELMVSDVQDLAAEAAKFLPTVGVAAVE